MKKQLLKIFALALITILSTNIPAQTPSFTWVKQIGGFDYERANSIVPYAVGNTYTSDHNISFYPNPVTDFIRVDLSDFAIGTNIKLYNSSAVLVFGEKATSKHNSFNIKHLFAGRYILTA